MDVGGMISGACVTLLGVLLLLDQTGTIELGFHWALPAVVAVIGGVLLATGLDGPRRR
jgi:hypothetical protein